MAEPTRFIGNATFADDVVFVGTVTLPDGTITNAMVNSGASIAAAKAVHRSPIVYYQAEGSDVASATASIYHARTAGEIVAVEVCPITAPTGGDKQFTVDVKNGDASTAFASVLSAVVTVDNTSVDKTPQTGTVSSATIADGDILQVVVTASGSTGSQGQGVTVVIWVNENPS